VTPPADEPPSKPTSAWNAVRSHAPGLLVLLAFFLAGDVVASLGRLPLPGSVVGMLLLAAALRLRWVPEPLVRPAADFLLRHMALLFVPPGVGLILHLGLVRREWVPIAAASAASTIAVLLCVGWIQQRLGSRG
jgi:holin-like protein